MATVTVERTSKPLKACLALSVLVMLAGLGLAWQWWGQPRLQLAAYVFGAGAVGYGSTRFACWWKYG